jgi:hypothetical protein
MKKIFTTTLLVFSCTLLFSQARFGIKAGLNFADVQSSGDADESGSSDAITSFHIGAFSEIGLSPKLVFQPALLLSQKGAQTDLSVSEGGFTYKENAKLKIMYIEVPLNFVAKFGTGSGKFLLGGGPYLGYGIGGEMSGSISADGPGTEDDFSYPLDSDIEFGDAEEEIKALDLGLNLLTGYELGNGLVFSAGYGLGLSNLSNVQGSTAKNRVFSLSVGYKFK